MHEAYVTKTQNAIMLVFTISSPVLLVAVVVGLTIGLLQALTQIQDQTLPQAIKLLAILIMIVLLGPVFGRQVVQQASTALDEFPTLTR